MSFWNDVLHNVILMSAASAWILAQLLKTLIYVLVNHKFDPERLVGAGGMPSSHSATVCALATAAAIERGGGSFEFAISAILALVVMYDARGVRLETGKQAMVLNDMIDLFEKMGTDLPVEQKLKEFIGHTPLQVVMGAIMGIAIGILVPFIMA